VQVRPWFIGIAVIIAAGAFSLTLMVPLTSEAPQRGMQPPQHFAGRH
jgi:hypothetical protein